MGISPSHLQLSWISGHECKHTGCLVELWIFLTVKKIANELKFSPGAFWPPCKRTPKLAWAGMSIPLLILRGSCVSLERLIANWTLFQYESLKSTRRVGTTR